MTRVMVVGGAGYVGSMLARVLLEQGYEVTVLDLLAFGGESLVPLLNHPRFRLVRGDIRHEAGLAEAMTGHDAVCLFAAIVGEPACNRDPDNAVATNLGGARNVLRAAIRAGVSRMVFASTCSNYGVSAPDSLVTEEAEVRPLATYAETKVAAEQEILAARGTGFFPTVLRLSTAFGVSARMRFDLLVSDFAAAAVRDRKIVIYGEQFWRPFVHIADIAAAVVRVLQAEPAVVSGEVFNVGANENNIQKGDLARLVARHVSGTVVETIQAGQDPRSYRVDFTRIARQLGYCAQWTLEAGVVEVVSALQKGVWRDPTERRYHN